MAEIFGNPAYVIDLVEPLIAGIVKATNKKGGLSMDDVAVPIVYLFLWTALIVFSIVCWWIVFRKAGKPGWGSIVPVYNLILICDIAGLSPWWLLLLFVPFLNLVAAPVLILVLCLGVAERFGRGKGFGVGLFFLQPIFLAILAFGDSQDARITVKPA